MWTTKCQFKREHLSVPFFITLSCSDEILNGLHTSIHIRDSLTFRNGDLTIIVYGSIYSFISPINLFKLLHGIIKLRIVAKIGLRIFTVITKGQPSPIRYYFQAAVVSFSIRVQNRHKFHIWQMENYGIIKISVYSEIK